MKKAFFKFLKEVSPNRRKYSKVSGRLKNIRYSISSEKEIEITSNEKDIIAKIILDELQLASPNTGYYIAKRICSELKEKGVSSVKVDGKQRGKKWNVILSKTPL